MTKIYKQSGLVPSGTSPHFRKAKRPLLNQLKKAIPLMLLTLLSVMTYAQTTLTGIVTDETGAPLPGVSVKVKNAPGTAMTDVNGKYNIQASAKAILEFTYVGYLKQEISVSGQNTINVTLQPDSKLMDEVIVVGYTTKNKSQIVSSVSTVTSKQLLDVTSNSTASLLQGKASGVMVSTTSGQPGTTPSIRIRGTGTITSGAEPLTVVDGIIGGSANPRDIESVTILKDAAPTGLYGSRAANGVLVITTKQGKSGKTKVDYSGSFGINNASQGNFKLMTGQQLLDFYTPLYNTDYTTKRNANITTLKKNSTHSDATANRRLFNQ